MMKEKIENEININEMGKFGFTQQAEFYSIDKKDIIFNDETYVEEN